MGRWDELLGSDERFKNYVSKANGGNAGPAEKRRLLDTFEATMAQWDQLFGTDKSFKEYVLEVVREDEVSTLKYDDIKGFLDMYVSQANASFEPPPKQRMDLGALISKSKGKALAELLEGFKKIDLGPNIEPNPVYYVEPKMMDTWGADRMSLVLKETREKLRPRLAKFKPTGRERVVIGIRLGSGCGKTHALVFAGDCLGMSPPIYITYSQDQKLERDLSDPRRALLIRLILALQGGASVVTGAFLNSSNAEAWFESGVTVSKLRELFVFLAKQQTENGKAGCSQDIVIGVDELAELSKVAKRAAEALQTAQAAQEAPQVQAALAAQAAQALQAAKEVVSELGSIAADYLKSTKGSMCTVLVTSQTWENFETSSGRSVEIWTPTSPDESTVYFFAQGIKNKSPEQAAALLTAVGGHHMRSLVVARRYMKEDHVEATVLALFKHMKSRLGLTLDPNALNQIKSYVVSCIKHSDDGRPAHPSELQRYTDKDGAIAPALILMAFSLGENEDASMAEMPADSQDSLVNELDPRGADRATFERPPENEVKSALLDFFDQAGIYVGAPKQLEEMSKLYDFFRQRLELPVVPAEATVRLPNDPQEDLQCRSKEWYRNLEFPSDMTEVKDSLLKQERDDTGPKVTQKIVYNSGVAVRYGDYFHPLESNHPWIDRAFLAKQKDSGERCLVLAQDKINTEGFPDAVRDLNLAASLLSKASGINDVLCIANVIGATEKTRAQQEFKTPYILIRGEKEVKSFFSVNFAVPIMFARKRHLLADQKKKESSPTATKQES